MSPEYDDIVWTKTDDDYFTKTGDYGGLQVNYDIYKLNQKYNGSSKYDFFLVDLAAFLALDSAHNNVIKKWNGNIKRVWLNSSLELSSKLQSDCKVEDYAPHGELNSRQYTTSVGTSIGASYSSNPTISSQFTFNRSVSWNYDGRKVISNSNSSSGLISTVFAYDGYTIDGLSVSEVISKVVASGTMTASGVLVLGPIGALVGAGLAGYFGIEAWFKSDEVKLKSNYAVFQQEMIEYTTFIIAVPKQKQKFDFEIEVNGSQIYIDYAWRNDHSFTDIQIKRVITVYN